MLARDLTIEQWKLAQKLLEAKYPIERVYLYLYDQEPLPEWVEEEIKREKVMISYANSNTIAKPTVEKKTERLLTSKEIFTIAKNFYGNFSVLDCPELPEYLLAQDAKTLKAMGEELKPLAFTVELRQIVACLLRGEFPGGD